MNGCHYALSKHVHACETGGVLIFLDLQRDQYFSLDRNASELLAPLLSGTREDIEGDEEHQRTLRRTVDLLMAQRLLSLNSGPVGQALPVGWVRPTESLVQARYRSLSNIPPTWFIDFLYAAVLAAGKLRWWSIARIVESIRVRRPEHAGVDPEKVADLMSAFVTLRPLFPKSYVCLFDSLASLELLARHNCFPQWVFAVKASPFGAHCWLQDGELVLNDSAEHVSAYTPIMVV